MLNVLVTLFEVESEGYQACAELKQNACAEDYFVSEAALIKKEAGGYQTLDAFDSGAHTTDDAVVGSLVGMCLGVLGGPIGVLLGAGEGALLGMAVDTMDAVNGVSMLEQIVAKLQDDEVVLIALANEESEAALDERLSKFRTVIARFDAAVVAQEVEKAREMQAELERLARIELRKQMGDEFKGKVEERRGKLKDRFAELQEERLKALREQL